MSVSIIVSSMCETGVFAVSELAERASAPLDDIGPLCQLRLKAAEPSLCAVVPSRVPEYLQRLNRAEQRSVAHLRAIEAQYLEPSQTGEWGHFGHGGVR